MVKSTFYTNTFILLTKEKCDVVGSFGKSMFTFVRNHQKSGCTVLPSKMRVPIFPQLTLSFFPDFGHTVRYIVVSGFSLHFPLTYDVEHLFTSLLAICIFS